MFQAMSSCVCQIIRKGIFIKNLKMIENELVPVYVTDKGEKVVYGTEIHAVLEVKSRFNDWVKNRLDDCGAVKDKDFELFTKNLVNGGRIKEYIIRLDTAKEMAMLEKNAVGKKGSPPFHSD